IGKLVYNSDQKFPMTILVVVVVMVVVLAIVIGVVCIYRRRANESDQEVKNMQVQMDKMESKVANICREAFAELQTDMSELDTVAGSTGIPYLEYRVYLMRVLFPDPLTADQQHSLLLSNARTNSHRRGRAHALDEFNRLLENKVFMMSLIRCLEQQRSFTMKQVCCSGLIMVILHDRLHYATEILEDLLADLIRKNMEGRNHPKLLLRRTESVAEKMLTHWFSILLYRFVVECAGEPLFMLCRAIRQQVDKGPIDSYTGEARYSLSEDKLLRQDVEHRTITLRVSNYMDTDHPDFVVRALSCDSVSQVKRKILDVAYTNVPYSVRPHPDEVDIEWRQTNGSTTMRDDDSTSKSEGEWTQVNTLEHYGVSWGIPILFGMDDSNTSLPRHKQSSRSGTPTIPQDGTKYFHLVRPGDQDQREGTDRSNKMVSEIYLTRLLTTKGTIQKYVDDLFETIFSVVQRGHALPLAVKHMFDFLDHQADIHGITDPEIVHTWKSNCLPLRFWVNLIKNPEFVYDINKSPIVDCYLSVIAQTFMDSCSTAEHKLGKESPSNKLLYAKDIPAYKQWVERYYADISNMQQLNHKDLMAFLAEESFIHQRDFNTQAALSQLYTFVEKYSGQILESLDNNPEAKRQALLQRMVDVCGNLK
uniref:Uncharacterized protein n=1 Tax=Ciona savignyi TaxID=51511 RepID=H2YK51_CIOSA